MAKAKTKARPQSKAAAKKAPKGSKASVKASPRILIGVVTSRFNEDVTLKLEEGAFEFLQNQADEGMNLEVISVRVPGAMEIPLTCQSLIELGCDGVVALGAVVRGETSHYDYVCSSVERGITQLILQSNRPIGFGVLTTENEAQAMARAGGEHGNKGADAAQAVLEMIGLQKELHSSLKKNKS